jgi:transcriptional regulator GlxA family with amidase domain
LTDPEPELQSTLLEAFELIIHTHSSAPHLAKARLWWLLFELFQSDSKPNPKPTHANLPPVLQTVVAIIDHELHTHLPLRALTARVGISHAQLYRLFQSYFHCSPSRYLQQKRREKAEELLLNSSMEIKQIATLVGFSDAQQFNKWCKKQLGASPRKVRNSNLESPLAE